MAPRSAAIEGRRDAPTPDRLPTLTEVVELGKQTTAAIAFGQQTLGAGQFADAPDADGAAEAEAEASEPVPAISGATASRSTASAPTGRDQSELSPGMQELTALVLVELQPRVEMLLEARLSEALAPVLARAAEGLIRDSRQQLAEVLQSLAEEAVAKVLEQRRFR